MNNLYRLNTSALQEQIHFCNEQSYSRELMTQRYDESHILHYQALVCTVWEYKMRIARYKSAYKYVFLSGKCIRRLMLLCFYPNNGFEPSFIVRCNVSRKKCLQREKFPDISFEYLISMLGIYSPKINFFSLKTLR